MRDKKMQWLILTSLFAALIFVTVRFIPAFPLGNMGYVNFGDTFIYLSALMLPAPFACVASALGAGLADLSFNAVLWVIPTIIIKSLLVLSASFFAKKTKGLPRDISIALCGVITVVGYYLAEVLLLRFFLASADGWRAAFVGASASIVGNAMQAIVCGVAFVLISSAMHRIPFFRKFWK